MSNSNDTLVAYLGEAYGIVVDHEPTGNGFPKTISHPVLGVLFTCASGTLYTAFLMGLVSGMAIGSDNDLASPARTGVVTAFSRARASGNEE